MVSSSNIVGIQKGDLFLHSLPRNTQKAFLKCSNLELFKKLPWYLAGGTGLALQVGHRESVDLDFFLPQIKFEEMVLERILLETHEWQTAYTSKGTIYGKFLEAKMSFIAYPFFIPSRERIAFGTLRLLLPHDIAAMKIIAISQRGRKRDFVDLFWYCQNREPLFDIIQRATSQFSGQEKNINHILRSLTYFNDAEDDPMPKNFFKANWKLIKMFLKSEVVKTTKKFLNLR